MTEIQLPSLKSGKKVLQMMDTLDNFITKGPFIIYGRGGGGGWVTNWGDLEFFCEKQGGSSILSSNNLGGPENICCFKNLEI